MVSRGQLSVTDPDGSRLLSMLERVQQVTFMNVSR
jgi:hypothetical protein